MASSIEHRSNNVQEENMENQVICDSSRLLDNNQQSTITKEDVYEKIVKMNDCIELLNIFFDPRKIEEPFEPKVEQIESKLRDVAVTSYHMFEALVSFFTEDENICNMINMKLETFSRYNTLETTSYDKTVKEANPFLQKMQNGITKKELKNVYIRNFNKIVNHLNKEVTSIEDSSREINTENDDQQKTLCMRIKNNDKLLRSLLNIFKCMGDEIEIKMEEFQSNRLPKIHLFKYNKEVKNKFPLLSDTNGRIIVINSILSHIEGIQNGNLFKDLVSKESYDYPSLEERFGNSPDEQSIDAIVTLAQHLPYLFYKEELEVIKYSNGRVTNLSELIYHRQNNNTLKEALVFMNEWKARSFSVLLVFWFLFCYSSVGSIFIFDIVSDFVLGCMFFYRLELLNGFLTFFFIIAPFMAGFLSRIYSENKIRRESNKRLSDVKWRDVFTGEETFIITSENKTGCESKKGLSDMNWRNIFTGEETFIITRMRQIFKIAVANIYLWKNELCFTEVYSAFQCHRCKVEKLSFKTEVWINEKPVRKLSYMIILLHTVRMLPTKVNECLNESCPQLLLQLYIMLSELLKGNSEVPGTLRWISIIISLCSLSITACSSHNKYHLDPPIGTKDAALNVPLRILEFVAYVLTYGSRIFTLALVATANVWIFIIGCFVYIPIACVIIITGSKRRDIYRNLFRYRATSFWPVHRIFTIPFYFGIWRLDSVDHILFYLETFVLSTVWRFELSTIEDSYMLNLIFGLLIGAQVLGMCLLFLFNHLHTMCWDTKKERN